MPPPSKDGSSAWVTASTRRRDPSGAFSVAVWDGMKDNTYVRGTVAAQKVTGAFVTLESTEDSRLVAVSTPAAASAEIHASEDRNGVMHMHAIRALRSAAKRHEIVMYEMLLRGYLERARRSPSK